MSWRRSAISWNGDIYTYTRSNGEWIYRHKTNPGPAEHTVIAGGAFQKQPISEMKEGLLWKWVHSGTGEIRWRLVSDPII
tara:strand:- start:689 stop:928 length:240 start_codon:yes stop_codon:yes gene_type:complete